MKKPSRLKIDDNQGECELNNCKKILIFILIAGILVAVVTPLAILYGNTGNVYNKVSSLKRSICFLLTIEGKKIIV